MSNVKENNAGRKISLRLRVVENNNNLRCWKSMKNLRYTP